MFGPGGGMPGGPGGGRPGGPGFGGPHGGPGFGGAFGHGGRFHGGWGRGYPGPIRKAPGGTVATNGDYFSGKTAKVQTDFYCNRKLVAKNTGSKTKGFIAAYRLYAMGPLHYNVFTSRIEAATKDFAERRITDEQCKYRKLKAADKYYSYMYSVGLYTKEQFEYELNNYANEIGVNRDDSYIIEQVFEESKVSRSR